MAVLLTNIGMKLPVRKLPDRFVYLISTGATSRADLAVYTTNIVAKLPAEKALVKFVCTIDTEVRSIAALIVLTMNIAGQSNAGQRPDTDAYITLTEARLGVDFRACTTLIAET